MDQAKRPGLTKERRQWLASLKVGDRVLYRGRDSGVIREIRGRTTTSIRLERTTVSAKSGWGEWDVGWIEPVTPEVERAEKIAKAAYRLRHQTQWDRLPNNTVLAVARIVMPDAVEGLEDDDVDAREKVKAAQGEGQ